MVENFLSFFVQGRRFAGEKAEVKGWRQGGEFDPCLGPANGVENGIAGIVAHLGTIESDISARFDWTLGHICPIVGFMKREAFLRELRAYARANGLAFYWNPSHGKGGHGRVTVGEAFTTVPSGEIKTGLKAAMLKQLGLPIDAV